VKHPVHIKVFYYYYAVQLIILGPMRKEVIRGWRKLRNEKIRNLYSPNNDCGKSKTASAASVEFTGNMRN
jgi:hypothetical protein